MRCSTAMQLGDGGWGWFSGWGEQSWPHTTATVVHGLQVAAANGVEPVPPRLFELVCDEHAHLFCHSLSR